MPDDIDKPLNSADPTAQYETLQGFLILHLGITPTHRFETNEEKALAEVADCKDKFLLAAVRVRRKRG